MVYHMMQPCDNRRFILRFYTCRSSVLISDCKWKFLFNCDENATIDADSTISTFIGDCSDSYHMCDVGISVTILDQNILFYSDFNILYFYYIKVYLYSSYMLFEIKRVNSKECFLLTQSTEAGRLMDHYRMNIKHH